MSPRRYTSATTIFVPDRINVWLRFATPVRKRRLDRCRSLALFAPHSIFALLRWERGQHGTAISHITIMRAVAPGETCSMWPFVHPGAETLLFVSGWHKVERALRLHDLRHTFASIGAEQGMSLQVIGALLGHKSPETTARYAHLADPAKRRGVNQIGAFLMGNSLAARR